MSTPPESATAARDVVRKLAPKLIEMTEKVVYWPTAMTAGRIAAQVLEEGK